MTQSIPPQATQCCLVDKLEVSKAQHVICRVSQLQVDHCERVGLVGANGSGKTTLLRVLAGLERDYSGACSVSVKPQERVYVHQIPCLFNGTVLHNVTYGLVARGIAREKRDGIANAWLAKMGLAEFGERSVKGLSGGERRRVALARACVLKPQLLLLDEPLAELDEMGIECVKTLVRELQESTILISSPTQLPTKLVSRCVDLSAH